MKNPRFHIQKKHDAHCNCNFYIWVTIVQNTSAISTLAVLQCASSPLDGFNWHLHLYVDTSVVWEPPESQLSQSEPESRPWSDVLDWGDTESIMIKHPDITDLRQAVNFPFVIKNSMVLEHQQKTNHLFLVASSAVSKISFKIYWYVLKLFRQISSSQTGRHINAGKRTSLEEIKIIHSPTNILQNTRYYGLTLTCKQSRFANCNQWLLAIRKCGQNA